MISQALGSILSLIRQNMKCTNKDEIEEDDSDSEKATGRMQFFQTIHLLLTKRKNLLELDNLCIDERFLLRHFTNFPSIYYPIKNYIEQSI